MKRLTLYFLIMVLLGMPSGVLAQDQDGQSMDGDDETVSAGSTVSDDEFTQEELDQAWEEISQLPPLHYALEPVFDTKLGYNFVDVDGSNRALEYLWPHSSFAAGLVISYNPLPHRTGMEIDWLNKHDYHADVNYAYRDIIKLDYLGWSLYHNLDHFRPLPSVLDFNPGENYHVTARDNDIYLRLKWPDRPYHAFAEYHQFEREGTIQQRFDAVVPGKASKSRDIEWVTRRIEAGLNGNLGIVEVEYTHMIKTFDPHKDVVLVDDFPAVGFPFVGTDITHNRVSELETNSDTIKVHTDLTGRVVASATLVTGQKDNNTTDAQVDFRRAFADLVLIPFENVTVALKYRFKELQVDAPLIVNDVTNHGPVTTKDPMDRRTNCAEVTVRYSPSTKMAVKAEYIFENTERENAKAWSDPGPHPAVIVNPAVVIFPFQDIPSNQNRHTFKLGVNARPLSNLKVRGGLEYVYTQDPSYPIDAVNSYRGKVNADWTPMDTVSASAYYRFRRDDNNTANMEAERDSIGALASWSPTGRLSFYANYDYSRYSNSRDLRIVSGDGASTAYLFPVEAVPYSDTSHLYALGAGYTFEFPLAVNAEFHQSWSKGRFRTSGFEPVIGVSSGGIGELTDLKVRETGGSLSASYDLPKGWGTSLTYNINDYQDLQDKEQNGEQDGTAHSVLVMLSKTW